MSTSHDELLAEARRIYADDPERATALRREIAASNEVTPAWSNAHVDLASYEYGQGNYNAVVEHAMKVLAAPASSVDPGARAVAGVFLADAQEILDQPIDEPLLAASAIAAAAAGHPYYAGVGLAQLARMQQRRGERAASKASFERAAHLYNESGSAIAGPGALLRLATLEHEDGENGLAREHIEAALAHLDRFPLAGRSGYILREKLMKLRRAL